MRSSYHNTISKFQDDTSNFTLSTINYEREPIEAPHNAIINWNEQPTSQATPTVYQTPNAYQTPTAAKINTSDASEASDTSRDDITTVHSNMTSPSTLTQLTNIQSDMDVMQNTIQRLNDKLDAAEKAKRETEKEQEKTTAMFKKMFCRMEALLTGTQTGDSSPSIQDILNNSNKRGATPPLPMASSKLRRSASQDQ